LAGRLTQAEFAERVETAYAARVGDELALTQKPLPNVAIAPAVGPRRKPTRLTPAVFRHVIKRGSWRLRRWSLAASVFSDLDLDVRGAERDTTHSVITVLVAFGNADVYVPDDIDVTVGGSASSADGVIGATARAAAPTIRVRVLSLFGTFDLAGAFRHETRHGEIIDQLRDRQRQLPT